MAKALGVKEESEERYGVLLFIKFWGMILFFLVVGIITMAMGFGWITRESYEPNLTAGLVGIGATVFALYWVGQGLRDLLLMRSVRKQYPPK